jgi:anti-sigma B factor antagonist
MGDVRDVSAANTRPRPSASGPRRPDSTGDLPPGTGHERDDVVVLLGGDLDIATVPDLARKLTPLARAGSHLTLDLSGVQFCDCAGLSLFLRLRGHALAAGGSLRLAAVSPTVRRLIGAAGLQAILPII